MLLGTTTVNEKIWTPKWVQGIGDLGSFRYLSIQKFVYQCEHCGSQYLSSTQLTEAYYCHSEHCKATKLVQV